MGTDSAIVLASPGDTIQDSGRQQRLQKHCNVDQQHQFLIGAQLDPFNGDRLKVTVDLDATSAALKPEIFEGSTAAPGNCHQPSGVRLPPVVSIYRPPAARRALKLAEGVLHQLATPAACEHPSDYGHLASSASTRQQQCGARNSGNCGIPADKALHEPQDGVAASLPDSREGRVRFHAGEPVRCETSSGAEKNRTKEETVPDEASTSRAAETHANGGSSVGSSTSGTDSPAAVVATSRSNRPQRERRPDRAVYIPRARRSLTTPPETQSLSSSSDGCNTSASNNKISPTIKAAPAPTSNGSPLKGLPTACTERSRAPDISASQNNDENVISSNREDASIIGIAAEDRDKAFSLNNNNNNNCNKLPICDTVKREISVFKEQTPSNELSLGTLLDKFKHRSYSLEEYSAVHTLSAAVGDSTRDQCCDRLRSVGTTDQGEFARTATFDKPDSETVDEYSLRLDLSDTMHRNNNRNRNAKNTMEPPSSTMIIGGHAENEKIDRDEKELRRASQEINRSNRRIMKQTFNSDVLQIEEPEPPVLASRAKKIELPKSAPAPVTVALKVADNGFQNGSSGNVGTGGEEEEEDDWESMYDDNGDCLNPKMIDELTTAVGKVAIEVPQSDYKAYETKQAVLNDEEFPHVLEVSRFPAEFKTQDLMMLFSQYKETGFDIKWVDDTHALAVFSSSKIAAEVLAAGHAFVQVKPLAEATSESRSKARKCASSLQPYRARPVTCAALARRMVTTALGVRLKTAPEERENERRVLREAKERKLLAAKQRDEVWDS
ncbi:uncharacterized protein LOC125949276 [Anopheles darlingi]|uniref:uncharacterized protein LOC125949276 n=1 Tax=Anopheles darlingi TaxID=43151 RepID=UPI0020FFF884|nr:uncharacterized protein LOC125949276 [Anopheles darlingi]XP_049532135.1 uncharacterized protein LOC125949276 [Anopheles darlingi]